MNFPAIISLFLILISNFFHEGATQTFGLVAGGTIAETADVSFVVIAPIA